MFYHIYTVALGKTWLQTPCCWLALLFDIITEWYVLLQMKCNEHFLNKVWDSDQAQCSLVHPYSCSFIFTAEEAKNAAKNELHSDFFSFLLLSESFYQAVLITVVTVNTSLQVSTLILT